MITLAHFLRKERKEPPGGAGIPAADPVDGSRERALAALGSALQEWPSRLTAAAEGLSSVSKSTEDEFLSLGMSLQTFSSGCTRSSAAATSIVSMIDGGSGFDAAAFKRLFEEAHAEVESCARAIAGGVAGVGALNAKIEDIVGLQEFLRKLSRSITILGTVMRIETARVGESEFTVMTSVVDTLAQEIETHNAEIASIAKAVKLRLTAISDRMTAGLATFGEALAANRGQIQNVLKEMDAMAAQARGACRQIEERVGRIAPETGSVVAALQYHDICRQQIEHVAEVLQEAAAKVAAYRALSSAEQAALGAWVADALRIQISQLRHVINETDASARGISEHLASIASLARAQAGEVTALLSGDVSGGDRITNIGSNLESLSRLLSESREMITEMVNAVSAAGENIGVMSRQVANIESISENINLLALNTIIKVSRTGEAGRGLGVLADEIRKLAVSANEKIGKGAETITAVLAAAEEFKQSLSEEFNKKLASTDAILGRTQETAKELMQADTAMREALGALSDKTRELEAEITRIIQSIRFDSLVRSSLQRGIGDLEAMQAAISMHTRDSALPGTMALSSGVDALTHRYTMQSERAVHETTLKAHNDNGNGTSGISGAGREKASADLGSNVELF